MIKTLKILWQNIRRLSGDDAYERYLKHYSEFHVGDAALEDSEPLLSREEFFKLWQERKWKGIKRCC